MLSRSFSSPEQSRSLLIASSERSPALPQVPTTREAGLPEFQVLRWRDRSPPRRHPKPILDKLADALNQALDDEATTKQISNSAPTFLPPRNAARRRSPIW